MDTTFILDSLCKTYISHIPMLPFWKNTRPQVKRALSGVSLDSYTGRRFLAYMAALKEIPRKTVAAEIARVAAAVNLTAELDKRLSAYSGGMKQRLLLASALLGDPKLLILDEPTAGLDPKERVRLRELLADMAKDRIILVATHVVSDVETVATKVILLRAGKIVDAAPVPELIAKYAPDQGLEDVYLNVFGEGDGK